MVENNNQTRYHYTMTNKFDWKVIFENYDADLLNIVDPGDLAPESRHDLIDGILKDFEISILTGNVQVTKKYKEILTELIKAYGH